METSAAISSEEPLLRPEELASKLSVTRRTVHTLEASGKISGIWVGGQLRYRLSEVLKQLESVTRIRPARRQRSAAKTKTA